MADRVVLFDLDGTLINTGRLIHECVHPSLAQSSGLSLEKIQSIHEEYKATLATIMDFDPDAFIQQVAIASQHSVEELTAIFFNPVFYKESVFPEVFEVISTVKNQYPIGIFSQGVPSWQKRKLDLAELTPLFDPSLFFIAPRKTTKQFLSKLPRPCIVVDDNPEIITSLQHEPDIAPIFLDRSQPSNNPSQVHTLTEMLALI